MGGRGGYSGGYRGMSVDSIQRTIDRYQAVVESNRAGMMLDPNSKSAIVRRKAEAARTATTKALDEIEELEKAMKYAKRRKMAIPF